REMDPGPRGAIGFLERADFMVTLQGQHYFVQSLQQPLAAARIDLETQRFALWRRDGLRFQIDRDPPRSLRRLDLRGKIFRGLFVDNDGQNAVLETIGEEDIAKARADDGADAHFLQRPYRALARRARAEILPHHQDFCLTIGLAVEDELRILRAVRQIAQRAKGPLAERAANGIADQPLDADDNVSVDIGPHDWRSDG